MKLVGLTWDEVTEMAKGKAIVVHFDGIQRSGYCDEEHMIKKFSGCELQRMSLHDYQVTKWPERKKA